MVDSGQVGSSFGNGAVQGPPPPVLLKCIPKPLRDGLVTGESQFCSPCFPSEYRTLYQNGLEIFGKVPPLPPVILENKI